MSPRKHTQIITKTAATFSLHKEKYNRLVAVLYSQLTRWVNLMGALRVWGGQITATREPEEAGPLTVTSGSGKLPLCYQTFNKVNQKRASFTSGNSTKQPQVRRHKKHSDFSFKVLSKGRTRCSFRERAVGLFHGRRARCSVIATGSFRSPPAPDAGPQSQHKQLHGLWKWPLGATASEENRELRPVPSVLSEPHT